MKQKNYLFKSLTVVILSALLASCSSIGQISLSKSRYGNGIGLSFDKQLSKTEKKALENKTAAIKERARQRGIANPNATTSLGLKHLTSDQKEELPQGVLLNNKVIKISKNEAVIADTPKGQLKNKNNYINSNQLASNTIPVTMKSAKKKLRKEGIKKNALLRILFDGSILLALIFAIIIPPIGVAIYEGITSRFWLCLLLTFLLFLPGMIYAILIVTETI
jgi:uncharacterized membrane protein YqaE (UPF0057 family)